jgi:alkanesulfonate monooxygenase SsuD/methylene tetrahydromethanopterin reductase-like flavin-dependent oxidoreductase (luciferase family)
MVDDFAIVGTPEQAVAEIKRRYGDVATRITLSLPDGAERARWAPVFDALRES